MTLDLASSAIAVTSYYNFTYVDDCPTYQERIKAFCTDHGLKGIVLIGHEGINSTLAGTPEAIAAYKLFLTSLPPFHTTVFKDSWAEHLPFKQLKVRIKKEIVTMGQEGLDPRKSVGRYVAPKDWNALISDPDVIVVDTRNDYEVAIGAFKNAQNPQTSSFRDLPTYVAQHLDPQRDKKIAMYCTGGIRCEKSTAFMLAQGFEEVYHLQGGILTYLEEVPPEESLWEGACFVFDERVAVETGLTLSHYSLCHGCRRPISPDDKASPLYEASVTCPTCYPHRTEAQKSSARMRRDQLSRPSPEIPL